MKQCHLCGKKNQNSDQYCQSCGRPLPLTETHPCLSQSTRVAIVIIILLLGVIGYLLTNRVENSHFSTPPPPQNQPKPAVPITAVVVTAPLQPAVFAPKIPTAKITKTPSQKLKPNRVSTSEMVLIPAGEFTMGSPDGVGSPEEHPQHQVYLDAFYIDKNLVTFDQYDKFCEATGVRKPDDERWGRGTRPVISISWDEANAYASWAGKRLPTEAEYEKAARGGTDTPYFFGDGPLLLDDYACYDRTSDGKTQPVGQRKPNPYGLYDMVGNVAEWCSDWYGENYYAVSPAKNPEGPATGTERVLRGGSWWNTADFLTSAQRAATSPEHTYTTNGFRCAKTP